MSDQVVFGIVLAAAFLTICGLELFERHGLLGDRSLMVLAGVKIAIAVFALWIGYVLHRLPFQS